MTNQIFTEDGVRSQSGIQQLKTANKIRENSLRIFCRKFQIQIQRPQKQNPINNQILENTVEK